MNRNGAGRWLGLAVCLWAAAAFSQELPEPVLLTMLGTNYTAKELGIKTGAADRERALAISSEIQHVVMGAYLARAEFNASEEELKEFCRRQMPTGEELGSKLSTSNWFEETWAEWQPGGTLCDQRFIAACELKAWKAQKSLFDRYGGKVYEPTMSFPLAIEAGWAYLAEREAAGDFMIHNEELRAGYWKMLREAKPPLSPEEAGRAAFGQHPGELLKQLMLEFGKRKETAPPASSP